MFYSNICLFSLSVLTKHFSYKPAQFHIDIYNLLLDKTANKKCVVAPRGTSKSTVVTLCYVLWCALFRQKKFIVIISDTYTQAVFFLSAIKDELENNAILKLLWGNQKGSIWREDDIVMLCGCRIIARGSGMPIRGIKHNEARPDLIILDDCENDELVSNKERRDAQWSWFFKSVLPALDPDKGEVFVIGTILHYDSMLMKIYKSNQFKSLFFRIIDNGVPLWEERFPVQKINEIRQMYEEQGLIDLYYCEYLNEPINEDNADFKRDWFKFYEGELDYLSALNVYVAVDLAISKKDKSDYTVIIAIGADAMNNIYVLEYTREKLDPYEASSELHRLCCQYQPLAVGLETTAYQKAFQYVFEEAMRETNNYFVINEIRPDMDKNRRLKTILQPRFKAGKVYMKKEHTELQHELLTFPKGKHDDVIDALATGVQMAQPSYASMPLKVDTPKKRGYFYRNNSLSKSLSDY